LKSATSIADSFKHQNRRLKKPQLMYPSDAKCWEALYSKDGQ
jgi:hypothetical protein